MGHVAMRQVTVDAQGNQKNVIHNDDVSAACRPGGGMGKAPFAQRPIRGLSGRGRAAPLWITTAFLATTWVSEAQDFSGARQASRSDDQSARLAQTMTGDAEELQRALDQEHHRAELLARALTSTRHIEMLLTFHKVRVDSVLFKQLSESEYAKLRTSVQQERDRLKQAADRGIAELCNLLPGDQVDRLEQDLAAAKHDVETQIALAAKANAETVELKQAADGGTEELRKSLQQARDRAVRLEQDLAAAKHDVETQTALAAKANAETIEVKQAADSGAEELRKSLQQARDRADRLEQDLAAAKRDVEAQTALATKASDEASQLKQVAENRSAELKRSLQKEHDRAEALTQDLSMARTKIYAYEAQERNTSDAVAGLRQAGESEATELRTSLQQEQDRAGRLEQDLAAARRDVETQTALAAKAGTEAARLKQAADDGAAEFFRSLQQERDRGARLERELASERETKDAFIAPELVIAAQVMRDKRAGPDAAGPAAKDQATVAVARSDTQPGLADAEVARLMARASALLRQGDIGSARSVLERAAETGNAQASFTLAETYDPLVLRKWGAYGTRGDAAKARILYAKAQAGGIKEAKERLDSLRR
jgi:hypothetical protein